MHILQWVSSRKFLPRLLQIVFTAHQHEHFFRTFFQQHEHSSRKFSMFFQVFCNHAGCERARNGCLSLLHFMIICFLKKKQKPSSLRPLFRLATTGRSRDVQYQRGPSTHAQASLIYLLIYRYAVYSIRADSLKFQTGTSIEVPNCWPTSLKPPSNHTNPEFFRPGGLEIFSWAAFFDRFRALWLLGVSVFHKIVRWIY